MFKTKKLPLKPELTETNDFFLEYRNTKAEQKSGLFFWPLLLTIGTI